jgi:hypothetical protein
LSSYVFPGYPRFLAEAASELGLPDAVGPARRIAPLAAMANLCAQAAHGDPAHAESILARAAEFRDQLATAHRAAQLMLDDVEAGVRRPREPEPEPEAEPEPTPSTTDPRVARKKPRNHREP